MAGRILVGTSSWADPGFVKEWYPPKLPAKQRLPWYAQRFELVELNSSFYADRIAGAFQQAGTSVADAGQQFADWLKRQRSSE